MIKKYLPIVIFLASISVAACQQTVEKAVESDNVVLEPESFETKIKETKGAIIIDVCTPNEFMQQHLNNAVNLNFHADNFETHLANLDKNKPYFVYCWAGARSSNAAKAMRELGFINVYELKGGISNWIKQNKPVEKGSGGTSTQNSLIKSSSVPKL